jgi:geranyl diphosphate synthase
LVEEELDPFSLVADELSLLSNKLREMVLAEVPKLASAAEYFFKRGVQGKQFRSTVMTIISLCHHILFSCSGSFSLGIITSLVSCL